MASSLTYVAEVWEEIQEMPVAQASSRGYERHVRVQLWPTLKVCHPNFSEEIQAFKMNLHHLENPLLASLSFSQASNASGFRM